MSKADIFFKKPGQWQEEMKLLRNIVLDCGLTEDFKWMHPCYTWQDNNVVLIHGFKAYCALLFHKGSLLGDPEGILVQQTENVQAARQIRFSDINEIKQLESTIKAYINEAIEVEKKGIEVEMKKTSEYEVPEELVTKFEEMPNLETAFESLTPGRQRGYLLHFSRAKRSSTRTSRIERNIPKILEGKGLNDQ